MISILALAVAVSAAATGDFDGDGKADTAAIIRKMDGTREAFVTFASGQRVFVTRVAGDANLETIAPERIANLCEPIKRYMPDCTRRLEGRDREALWIELASGPAQDLALWNGTQFRVVTGVWPKNAARASKAVSKEPDSVALSGTVQSARSVLELDLSSAGKAEACRIVESSGETQLDTKACSIMLEKAKFKPGSGAGAGKRTTMRTEVVWRTTK